MILRIGLLAATLVAASFVVGCSSDSSSGGSSTNQSCSTKSACQNGICGCTDGPNKDKQCCDTSVDPQCTGYQACADLCKVCN